jgi:RNase H-fold protein (predicted Holliday junction resolvase)
MYVGGRKMIQILTFRGNMGDLKGRNTVINRIHDAQSLDDFEINIVNLNDENMWRTRGGSVSLIESINDFKSLSKMINNSKKTEIIILLPQNLTYRYNYSMRDYHSYIELKDMLRMLLHNVGEIYSELSTMKLVYENTTSIIAKQKIKASFFFARENDGLITSSSGKNVAYKLGKVYVSTLDLQNYTQIICFLEEIGLIINKTEIPSWMEEVQMFDDIQQLDLIRENKEKIQLAENEINKAKKVMDQNNRYKSILYTTGDELVEVVLEILGQLLNYDFSQFEDKKNEDFLAEIGDDVFIGEIKGVNHNVKSENISQLDVHYQGYLEDNEKEAENVHALLIMNYQKNKPIADREPVHEKQVALAVRNGSLIIDTYMLLKLFEKFKRNEINSEDCRNILKSKVGILKSI